jgi:HEAT repeat protein
VTVYFQRPPYPLFAIRRLIELADPAVIPAMRDAFDRETGTLARQLIAATLVRLGETDFRYFDYLARAALVAVNSDLPYRDDSTTDTGPRHDEIRAWAQARGLSPMQAIRKSTIELPAAVEALGEAADQRSLPILLRGLESPNVLVVREAAFGLARLQDATTVEPIITACRRLDPAERPWVAKSLLYFRSRKAQRAAVAMIADPERLRRWRTDVNREANMRTTLAKLSRAVQRLDRAAVQLDQLREAIREGSPAGEDAALKEYIRELTDFRSELTPLALGRQEYGLVSAVMDRLESQLSRLEQMKGHVLSGRSASVEEPLSQLKAALRMVQHKVIQGAK